MYRKSIALQLCFKFALPFGGELNPENRWIILSFQVPWKYAELLYADSLSGSGKGCPALSVRIALGALIIKERLGLTDRETVEQIKENPYLQFFIGLEGYSNEAPFDHSMMTHFRKRLTKETLAAINERIIADALGLKLKEQAKQLDEDQTANFIADNDQQKEPKKNEGKLIIDATCTPADITYPTDLKLLNEVREKTEEMIDEMHQPYIGIEPKPRTYRNCAKRDYLNSAKKKKLGRKQLRKALRKQLSYVSRNLKTIEETAEKGRLTHLSKRLYRLLLVSQEAYRQQQKMFDNKTHRIDDRIVNLHQPHIRPIVRGKAGKPVEFGAKISISVVNGFSYVDTLNWDAYNEGQHLQKQVELYKSRYGCYPTSVHSDKIYRTKLNRKYCKSKGIRLSGPPLGRPPKETETNKEQLKATKKQQRQDENDRQAVEGKFGEGKRRYTLNRIMAKLAKTAETVIMVSFIVMNLEKILRDFLFSLFLVIGKQVEYYLQVFQLLYARLWKAAPDKLHGFYYQKGIADAA